MIANVKQAYPADDAQHDAQFLELVPDIERFAQRAFRTLLAQQRQQAVCTVVADAFCAFRRLATRGKQDVAYAIPLARFAVAGHRNGRCFGNRSNSRDVCAVVARRRRGFNLHRLDHVDESNIRGELLIDDTATPILDQVAFRLDFSTWLRGLNGRDRKLARFLAVGNTATEAAQHFGLSRGRVSQLRRHLQAQWHAFQGEPCPAEMLRAQGLCTVND